VTSILYFAIWSGSNLSVLGLYRESKFQVSKSFDTLPFRRQLISPAVVLLNIVAIYFSVVGLSATGTTPTLEGQASVLVGLSTGDRLAQF
jgi:hypothetical protein